jgi:UDP-N-acetylmuramate--alanine ligase
MEADESDKSFLNFRPDHAIITNIAEDHFPLAELKQLFAQFEAQVSGVVVNAPDAFDVKVPMLGKHNIENVNSALTLCKALGLDMQKCIEAVSTFKGIERRLQRHGEKVIDDFAHSPIKIAAALEAASETWPEFNVVWRPHGFTPLFQGLEGFIDVFSNHWKKAEPSPTKLYILPVFYAGGTVDKKITSEQFVERLQTAGVPAEFAESFQCLEKQLCEEGLPVLVMGARDPELPRFAKQIAAVIGY